MSEKQTNHQTITDCCPHIRCDGVFGVLFCNLRPPCRNRPFPVLFFALFFSSEPLFIVPPPLFPLRSFPFSAWLCVLCCVLFRFVVFFVFWSSLGSLYLRLFFFQFPVSLPSISILLILGPSGISQRATFNKFRLLLRYGRTPTPNSKSPVKPRATRAAECLRGTLGYTSGYTRNRHGVGIAFIVSNDAAVAPPPEKWLV